MYIYTEEAEQRFVEDHMDVITWKQVATKKSLIDAGIDPSTALSLSKDMGFGEQAAQNSSAAQLKDEEDKKAAKEKKKAEQDEKAATRHSKRAKKEEIEEKEDAEEEESGEEDDDPGVDLPSFAASTHELLETWLADACEVEESDSAWRLLDGRRDALSPSRDARAPGRVGTVPRRPSRR